MKTITIGDQQVQRTVVGALSRLELVCAEFYQVAKCDVDFLRDEFNRVEAERDQLVEALLKIGSYPKARADEMSAADMRLVARNTLSKLGFDVYGRTEAR